LGIEGAKCSSCEVKVANGWRRKVTKLAVYVLSIEQPNGGLRRSNRRANVPSFGGLWEQTKKVAGLRLEKLLGALIRERESDGGL